MAARLNPKQDERSRSAIKTTQLIKRLQSFAFSETDEAGQPVEIDSGRMKAIEILLRKSLPDLSAVTLSGDNDNPITVTAIERKVVKADN